MGRALARVVAGATTTAILSMGLALAAPGTAAAAPGDLDPTFGGGDGRLSINAGFDVESVVIDEIEITADGGTFVRTVLPLGLGFDTAVLRFGPEGSIDLSWNHGNPVFPGAGMAGTSHTTIAVDSMDRLVVANGALVFRYTAGGAPDSSFSGDGMVNVHPEQELVPRDVEALPGGALALIGTREFDSPNLMMFRLTAAGVPDPAFSGDGRLAVPPPDAPASSFVRPLDLEADAGGNLYSLGMGGDGGPMHVAKVDSAGTPVSAFGGNGVATMPGAPYRDAELAIDGSGRPTVLAPTLDGYDLGRLTATGDPDESYGPGGLVTLAGLNAIGKTIAVSGTIAYVPACSEGSPTEGVVVAVDLANATLLSSFGPGGADGDGIRTISTNPVSEACTGAIDVTAAGHPRVVLTPWNGFDEELPTELVQLTPTGADDLTYSGDARSLPGVHHQRLGRPTALAEGPAGEIVVGGDVVSAGGSLPIGPAFVGKVTAAGVPAPGFGDGGRVEIPSVDDIPVTIHDLAVLPDGRVAVLHQAGVRSSVTLLDASGDPDLSFSEDGTVRVGFTSSERPVTSITTAGSGSGLGIFVAGRPVSGDADVYVQRLTLQGLHDQDYGTNGGRAEISFPARDDVLNERLLAGAADGTITWAAPAITPGPGEGLALGRVLASGVADPAFGSGGVRLLPGTASGAPEGTYDAPLHLRRRAGGGADVLAARVNGFAGVVAVRVSATGALDTGYSGDGVAVLTATVPDPIVGASMQGDRAVFLQAHGTVSTLLRLTAAGAPDTTLGSGGRRTAAYPFEGHQVETQSDVHASLLVSAPDSVVFASRLDVTPPGGTPGIDAELVKIDTEPDPPGAPSGVVATRGDEMATVTWTAPVDDGGAAVTGYTVTASPGGATCEATAPTTACAVPGLTNGQSYSFTVTATNSIGTGPASAASNSVTPAPGAGAFVPLPSPKRVVDSRIPNGDTDDEQDERFGPIPGGTFRAFTIAGRVGLPGDAQNVVLSVAAITPASNGYFTVFPCGTTRPLASSMNFTKGVTIANTVITTLGTGGANTGKICIYTNTTANIVVDTSGTLT